MTTRFGIFSMGVTAMRLHASVMIAAGCGNIGGAPASVSVYAAAAVGSHGGGGGGWRVWRPRRRWGGDGSSFSRKRAFELFAWRQ